MARRAEQAAPRFRRLKLKLGGGDGLDVERVAAVRGVTDLPLQVDVNECVVARRGARRAARGSPRSASSTASSRSPRATRAGPR